MTLDQCTVQARQLVAMDLGQFADVLQKRASAASDQGMTEVANALLDTLDVLYVLRRMLKTGTKQNPALSNPEPQPAANNHAAIWPLVIADMRERNESGVAKYGTPLQAFNGRKPLVDAYQELLDLAVYLRQEIYERGSK